MLDATLQALGFHHSPLGYLEDGALQFVNVTDKLELTIEPEDDDQPIMDYKDEMTRKWLKRAAKKKPRCDNLCAHMR